MRIAVSYVAITVIPCDPQMAKQQALQETVINIFSHFHMTSQNDDVSISKWRIRLI